MLWAVHTCWSWIFLFSPPQQKPQTELFCFPLNTHQAQKSHHFGWLGFQMHHFMYRTSPLEVERITIPQPSKQNQRSCSCIAPMFQRPISSSDVCVNSGLRSCWEWDLRTWSGIFMSQNPKSNLEHWSWTVALFSSTLIWMTNGFSSFCHMIPLV